MQIVWNAKTSSFYISSRSLSCFINYRRRPPRLCYSLSKKTHNWDPFKILIPTCRIICFLLIFAWTSRLQGLSVSLMGLDGIRWDSESLKLSHKQTRQFVYKSLLIKTTETSSRAADRKWLSSDVDWCLLTFRIKEPPSVQSWGHQQYVKTYQSIMFSVSAETGSPALSVQSMQSALSSMDPQTSCWTTTSKE